MSKSEGMGHPNLNHFPQPQLPSQITTMAYFPQPQLPSQIPTMAYYPQPQIQTHAPAISPVQLPPSVPLPPSSSPATSSLQAAPEPQHKNRLQEAAHKLNIQLPMYETVNEGLPHAPKFRSAVVVDGRKFTSPDTFWTRKAAEKHVAEIALKHLSQKIINEDRPQNISLIQEDVIFCKSILNEFAAKMNMCLPAYNTVKSEGLLPLFTSSLAFNGVSYTGSACKSKKEAEQLAARAVILSLLDEPTMGKVLRDVITSKGKLYAAWHKVSSLTSPLPINTMPSPAIVPGKDIQAESSTPLSTTVDSLTTGHNVSSPTTPLPINTTPSPAIVSGKDIQAEASTPLSYVPVTTTVDSLTTGVYNDVACSALTGNVQPIHKFHIIKKEQAVNLPEPASSQAGILPIQFVHPVSATSLEAAPGSSKRRRKNKKKSNKRLCTGVELPLPNLTLNRSPNCSVGQ